MRKEVKNNLSVLERELNELYETHSITIPKEAFPYIRRAMVSFSVKAIQQERHRKRKQMVDTLKHLPRWVFVGYYFFFRARIKKWFFKMAVKQANIEAAIQNRKIWVVQATDLTYKLISTKDFRNAKTLKVFRKELNFKDMDEVADATILPPARK